MKNVNVTPRSPKNKFRIEFRYDEALEGIGSVTSFGTMSVENLEENPLFVEAKNRGPGSYTIYENKSTYPDFDWEVVETVQYGTLLHEMAEKGYIVHNMHTGEEWLTDQEFENWIFLGVGQTSHWEDVEGVEQDDEIEFPGDNASIDIHPGYYMKNSNTLNPVNEFPGWEDGFEKTETGYRCKNPY